MSKIAVTGGSGKAGRAVVRDLLEHAELTDFGQTLEALSGGERMPGIEAVVHLAAIPSPVHATPDQNSVSRGRSSARLRRSA